MAVELGIDVALLKSEIRKTYAAVSKEPGADFIFPTGRAWAEDLRYPPELAAVPDGAVESFADLGTPVGPLVSSGSANRERPRPRSRPAALCPIRKSRAKGD